MRMTLQKNRLFRHVLVTFHQHRSSVRTITLELDPEGNGDPTRAESVGIFPVWALLLCPATRGL